MEEVGSGPGPGSGPFAAAAPRCGAAPSHGPEPGPGPDPGTSPNIRKFVATKIKKCRVRKRSRNGLLQSQKTNRRHQSRPRPLPVFSRYTSGF